MDMTIYILFAFLLGTLLGGGLVHIINSHRIVKIKRNFSYLDSIYEAVLEELQRQYEINNPLKENHNHKDMK